MYANKWNGVGGYDLIITLNEEEMRKVTDYYRVDWQEYLSGRAKTWGGEYYCFISYARKALALLPFLSVAFGGMYDELPMDPEPQEICLNPDDFRLEEFCFKWEDELGAEGKAKAKQSKGLKNILKKIIG